MAKMLRKTLVYGLLLATGVTLGMQLAESGTSSILGSGFQTGGTTAVMNGQSMTYPQSQQPQQSHQQLQQQIQQLQQQLQQYNNGWTAGSTPTWTTDQGNIVPQGTTGGYPQASGNGTAPSGTDGSNTTGSGQVLQTPADLLMPPPSPPAIDRFADKAAHLLQQASQKSIHWVASWFGPGE